jgi:hypothetical protein
LRARPGRVTNRSDNRTMRRRVLPVGALVVAVATSGLCSPVLVIESTGQTAPKKGREREAS